MEYSKEQIAELKKQYPHDTRLELQYMSGEPDMSDGLRGSVDSVGDNGEIYVHWDNGRALPLGADEDRFRKLTFEEEVAEWMTVKFYSPLLVQYFEVYDSEYLSDQRVSGLRNVTDSTKYINEITDAIKFNIQSYVNQEEFFISAISDYKIADNVMTLDISVEAHNDELWGVTTLKHKYPFSPNQINALKGLIEDEYKNYWGNQFKFANITPKDNGHNRLNVHFWQDTDDYTIMSEDEFQQFQLSEPAPAEETAEEVSEEEQKPALRIDIVKNGRHEIELPASEYDVIQALYAIGCDRPDAEYALELDQYHVYWGEYENLYLTGTNLYELNHLAAQIADFDDYQKGCFDAYVNSQDSVTVKQLINAAYNINDIIWHPFGDDKELGEFALDNEMIEEYNELPNEIYEALDLKKAGAKFREIDGGKFVNGGYLVTNDFDEVYDGITLPNNKELTPFRVRLCYDNENDNILLYLPANEFDMAIIEDKYHISDFNDLYMLDFDTTIPYIKENCEVSMDCFEELNELSKIIIKMDQTEIRKFKAVLEVEQPFFIKDALDLCGDLKKYDLYSHLTDPNDYGKMMVCKKLGLDYDDPLVQFIDNTEFGAELMKRNGIIPTQYGGLIVPPTTDEVQSTEDNADQDAVGEDESEDQGFEGMQMT